MSSLSFFSGVPDAVLEPFLESLERRTFAAGSVVVAEGDQTGELYLVEHGRAEVVVAGPDGAELQVGRVQAGETVGEMSLLTGQPAGATVRAVDEVVAIVVTEAQFAGFAERHPEVYRQLGAVLAERLARTNRLVARAEAGRVAVLADSGSPPLLGYALACSVAWHTRERTLLVALHDEPPDELRALATVSDDGRETAGREARAELLVAAPHGRFAAGDLPQTLDTFRETFKHVLVQGADDHIGHVPAAKPVQLRGSSAAPPPRDGVLIVRGWTEEPITTRPHADGVVDIPPLAEADIDHLRSGLLPPRTAAGKRLGWAARDLARLKVGLALGAGSLRGWAHVGVIDAVQRAGIPIDYIAGTSVGASVAGLFALGKSPDEIADVLTEFSPNLFRLTLPFRSLLSNRAMRRYMQEMAAGRRLEDLDVPVAIVAADINTQREVVFRRGSVWQAVLTSVSIPGIYPASPMGDFVLVDGGVLNPVPADVVVQMGADVVVAVRLGAPTLAAEYDFECIPAEGRPPPVVGVLLRSIEIMQSRIQGELPETSVVTIAPVLETAGAKLKKFADGRRFIADGAAAAEEALPRLAAVLPWLRG